MYYVIFSGTENGTMQKSPVKRRRKVNKRSCQRQGNSEGDTRIEETCSEVSTSMSSTVKETVSESLPVVLTTDWTLLEKGKCYRFGEMAFAATELSNQSVKGEVIIDGKLDHDIHISMPVDRISGQSDRKLSSGLPKQDRDYLSRFSLDSPVEQEILLNSSAGVRHSVRSALLGRVIRREITSALSSKTYRKRVYLGLCSVEHDLKLLQIDRTTKKASYSYKDGNMSELDQVLGLKWDVMELDESYFRFVTQVVFKAKDMMLFMNVSTALCRQGLIECYRDFIKSSELTTDEGDSANLSDHEELDLCL